MSGNFFTLFGRYVDLELLNRRHEEGLSQVVAHDELWQHPQTFIPTPELVPTYIKLSEKGKSKGKELPFAIVDKSSQKIIGSIKLQNIHAEYAEIGSTFIDTHHQRNAVNKEAKFILLQHAFESMQMQAIHFVVHQNNLISQRSLEQIGIQRCSCFSHLKMMPDWEGDAFINYSITTSEWEKVKEKLEFDLFS